MNIALTVTVIVIILIILTWGVYNFWWLNRPQVYLAYKDGASFPFDADQGSQIAKGLGGSLANMQEFTDSFNQGASLCTFGYVTCDGCTTSGPKVCNPWCAPGSKSATLLPLNVKGETAIPNCGKNNSINGNGTVPASGYWIYGPKPSSNNVSGWTIAPFHAAIGKDTDAKFNQYEIFGIPKFF